MLQALHINRPSEAPVFAHLMPFLYFFLHSPPPSHIKLCCPTKLSSTPGCESNLWASEMEARQKSREEQILSSGKLHCSAVLPQPSPDGGGESKRLLLQPLFNSPDTYIHTCNTGLLAELCRPINFRSSNFSFETKKFAQTLNKGLRESIRPARIMDTACGKGVWSS